MGLIENEKCQKERCVFDHYKIGSIDSSGREIEQIVHHEVGSYMIYLVKGDYLKAYLADSYEIRAYFSEAFQLLLSEIWTMNVENVKNNSYIRQSCASAYFNELNGYHQVAIGELTALKERLRHKSYTKWLTAYMVCNIILVIFCFLQSVYCSGAASQEIICCITSSCIGSFLIFTKKENGASTIHYLPVLDATISFFASCVSGFIVYCILQTNLIFSALTESNYSMMIICFISGYNEDIPLKLLNSISNIIGSGKHIGKA